MATPYPRIISDLPQADIPMAGVRGWLLQGDLRQAVFFDLPAGAVVPEHAHGAQWRVVLEGEIDLTIAGSRRTYRKGDAYEIPADAPHSALCPNGARVLDLFADPRRYRPKTRA